MIQGVELLSLKVAADNRGKLMKMIDINTPLFDQFGEIYFSFINPGIIKGWKKHFQVTQLMSVPVGAIKFVIYDDRADSLTRGQIQEIESGENNYCLIKIPPGLWYSWKALSDFPAMIASFINKPHDPAETVSAEININPFIPFQWK